MSRSRRHTPKHGICKCRSEKKDKRRANRKLRARHRHQVHHGQQLSRKREVSDVWDFGKDGKVYQGKWILPKLMRK